jgi:hypothetical protein
MKQVGLNEVVFAVELLLCQISAPKVIQTIQINQVKQPPSKKTRRPSDEDINFFDISPHSFHTKLFTKDSYNKS